MPFNRRRLLRGLGGAAVAAPFLSSVAERAAKAAGTAAPAPKRLIVLFTHYGCLTNRWFPAKSHGPLTKSDYMNMRTLAPMAPYADKLLMVRGVRAMNEWSFEGNLGQTLDPHIQPTASFFTCQPLVGVLNSHFSPKPAGRSLDHVCAEQVNSNGVGPLLVQIGGISGSSINNNSVISYRQLPDQTVDIFPGLGTPRQLFTPLTNLFGQGPMSPDSYRVARGKSVIDVVRDDLKNLMRVNMSLSDKKKLSDWVSLLDQTSKPIVAAQCSAANAAKLGVTDESVTAAGQGSTSDLSRVTNLMMDLAALQAACDMNRVIFLKYPPVYVFKFLGLTVESHGLSHRIGNANMGGKCLDNVFEMIAAIDSWYAQQFAYLVGRLDSISEGDRTLLDNSATVWFQEMSDGNAHNLNNLPILQAGSCGGFFKVGQAVNVEGAKADLTPGHSEDDCVGGESAINKLDALGTPPDVATQPINKYFCNLMNAIGVKAGPDGFPAIGGTEPVTRYGKYDDTALFNTTTPATLKNPGEFTALRAS